MPLHTRCGGDALRCLHPQYSEWIQKQIKKIEETRDVTTDDINNIIYEAKCHFQIAWENYLEKGDNINDYFKTLN